MQRTQLTIATGDYDRVRPLWDGTVNPEGIALNMLLLPVEEIFFRMARYQEFDACEMSLSSFLISQYKGHPSFTAIPVFPSRKFRHADIYINADSDINKPEDLQGGRIGVPEYQITAAVWMRGFLQEFYGVDPQQVQWFTGGTERPGREERLKIELPPPFKKERIPDNTTLFELLKHKELDCIFTARTPSPYLKGEKWIKRLFPQYRQTEQEYYQQTKIFPIMHLIVFKKEVYEKYPWAAQSLYKAFVQAKNICFERLVNSAALPVSLPWFNNELEETISLMGQDFWSYGLAANKATLEKALQYMKNQGLLPEAYNPDIADLFAPNTLGQFGL